MPLLLGAIFGLLISHFAHAGSEREIEPTAHAPRVGADASIGRTREPDTLEKLSAARFGHAARDAVQDRLQPHQLQ